MSKNSSNGNNSAVIPFIDRTPNIYEVPSSTNQRALNEAQRITEEGRSAHERALVPLIMEKGIKRHKRYKREKLIEQKRKQEEETNRLREEAYKKELTNKKKLNKRFDDMVAEIKSHKEARRKFMYDQGVREKHFEQYDKETKTLTTKLYRRLFKHLKPTKLAEKYQPGNTFDNSKTKESLKNYEKALTEIIRKLVKESREETEKIKKKLESAVTEETKTQIRYKAMHKKKIDIRTLSSLVLAIDNDDYRIFLYFIDKYDYAIAQEYIDVIKKVLVEEYGLMKLPGKLTGIVKNNDNQQRLKKKAYHAKKNYEINQEKARKEAKVKTKARANAKVRANAKENAKAKKKAEAKANAKAKAETKAEAEAKAKAQYNANFPPL
jgi:hypothetical protein